MLAIKKCKISHPSWQISMPDIALGKGEILVLSGPSGLGKSTFLHWLLGDNNAHVDISGEILIDNQPVGQLAIEHRRIGLLLQDIHLFPHLNVLENICFALPRTNQLKGKRARQDNARELLSQIDLAHLEQRYSHQLSGGEKARVGLLRALANSPRVMLLDEPFAALDPKTRLQVSQWAIKTLQNQQIPTIMVSHDLDDIPDDAQHLELSDYYIGEKA